MDPFINPVFEADFQRSPLVVVDVGASGGAGSRWRSAERHLQLIGFDADERAPDADESGRNLPVRVLNVALHRAKARLDFHLTKRQENSSIFMPNRAFLDQFPESDRYDVVDTVQMEADALDAQLSLHGIPSADFMKVDTQGSELSILEGAEHTLRSSVIGLEVEVEFAPLYQGQPLFVDVERFLTASGFCLLDLRPYYWKRKSGQHIGGPKGQLVFADALYVRDLPSLAALLTGLANDADRRAKVLHLMSVCVIYGYLDYALTAFRQHQVLFSSREVQAVEAVIGRQVSLSTRLPAFAGRGHVAVWLNALHGVFQQSHRGWGSAGPKLGNS